MLSICFPDIYMPPVSQISSKESGFSVLEAPSVTSLAARHGGTGMPGQSRSDRAEMTTKRLSNFDRNSDFARRPVMDAKPPPSVFSDHVRTFTPIGDYFEMEDGDTLPHHTRIRKDLQRVLDARLSAYEFEVGVGVNNEIRALKATLSVAPHFQPEAAKSPYRFKTRTGMLTRSLDSKFPYIAYFCLLFPFWLRSGHAFELRIVLFRGEGKKHFPINAPAIRFKTRQNDDEEEYLKHYAIDNDGDVCLPLITEIWSPTTSLVAILEQLETLIVSPGKIDRTGKYAKQAILADRLRGDRKAYDRTCALAANRAPQVHFQGKAKKLEPTLSMLGMCDETRFKKVDEIIPPTKRPENALPGWPYSEHQPKLHKVWLGGGPTQFDSDTLAPFASEEKCKRLLSFPIMALFLIINNLVKKLSWFCLILRSLDGMAVIPDMCVPLPPARAHGFHFKNNFRVSDAQLSFRQ